MRALSIGLSGVFRSSGWQWVFRPGDVLRVFTLPDCRPIAEIEVELLNAIVLHYLTAHQLTAEIGRAMTDIPDLPMRPPPAAAPLPDGLYAPDRLAKLKARRRSRKPPEERPHA